MHRRAAEADGSQKHAPRHAHAFANDRIRDCRFGLGDYIDYYHKVAQLPIVPEDLTGDDLVEAYADLDVAVIGTPDDAIAKIEELVEASDGGFGAFLLFDHDWAPPAAKLRSYELFAQYVIPHFTGQLAGPIASRDWVTDSGTEFVERAAHAIGKAIEDHAAEREAKTALG